MPTKVKKFDPKDNALLLSPERRHTLDVHRIMSLMPLQPYHWVADIGCGPGYFTLPLAKYLFSGKVFALDIQQPMLDATRESLDTLHLTNAELLLSKESKLPLEDESLDGALAAFVLQEANSPKALLKDTLRCLKKSGWLVILEWHKREMEEGPPLERRIDLEEMLDMTGKLGYRLSGRRDLNGSQYMVVVRK